MRLCVRILSEEGAVYGSHGSDVVVILLSGERTTFDNIVVVSESKELPMTATGVFLRWRATLKVNCS
jgi:hypothetical protein